MRWAGHEILMGKERKVYRVFVGKPEGKRPLGRPRHKWEDGIRMDLRDTGRGKCGLDPVGSGIWPVADSGSGPTQCLVTYVASVLKKEAVCV
jgi:hypothetical protein